MKGSCLFVLPQKETTFERILDWEEANSMVFDLEDGCPSSLKEKGRNNIFTNRDKIKCLRSNLILRVNSLDDEVELIKDLELLGTGLFEGVMLTKVRRAKDVLYIEQLISNANENKSDVDLHVLIETTHAYNAIKELARSSKRIKSLCLGMHDLRAELNATNNEFTNNALRLNALAVARENGISVLDTPFLEIKEFSHLFKRCEHIKMMGMDGAMCIHPDHIGIINRSFSITKNRADEIESLLSQYSGGCELINGEFVGPPTVKKLMQEQNLNKQTPVKITNSLTPKVIKYGLDIASVYPEQVINCPYEITVDESWITSWSSLISMGNYIETSKEYARELGLKDRILPFSAMVNLTLCMAVEPFSETCLLHLGLEDVRYESPAYPGDTFKCFVLVESLRNTSDGKRSVIKSQHVLLNQKNERIISFERKTLFPRIKGIEKRLKRKSKGSKLESVLWNKLDNDIISYFNGNPDLSSRVQNNRIEENDLILHDAMRHIGESENLLYTTLYRNTHPIHFNYMRYDKKQIIVCGGFVMAVVLGNAMKDFKQVIAQKIINCSHINKVTVGDNLSSVSFIYRRVLNGNIETLKMVSLGLVNIDSARKLKDCPWPQNIFSKDTPSPKLLEAFLKKNFPELFHKICIHVHWEVSRFSD